MRNQLKIVYSALTIVAMLGLTSTVHGVPAFARQTGLDCNSCHAAAGWPMLNSFGQAFKAGGYTQASEDSLMGDGEALSIPKSLNAAVIFKMRTAFISQSAVGVFTKTTTAADAAKGQLASPDAKGVVDYTKTQSVGYNQTNMPDEWAVWFAGRAGKHVGFAVEVGRDADGTIGPLSFKVPLTWDIGPLKIGAVPYWTDAQGPGFGFENLSTGAVGNIKMFENGPAQSARMYLEGASIGTGGGQATGLGLYVWHAMGYLYYSPFLNTVPADVCSKSGTFTKADCTTDLNSIAFAHNLRAAITPSLGAIDLAVGFQWEFGNWALGNQPGRSATSGALDSVARNALKRIDYLGFDAQVLGTIGIPVALVGTLGMADGTKTADGKNQAGAQVTAWSVLLNATVVEDLLNIGLGFRGASYTYFQVKSTDAAGVNTLERQKYTPEFYGTAAAAGTAVVLPVLSDNQLIGEVKLNIARNLRLSLTGYLPIGSMDVVSADGKKMVFSQNATWNAAKADLTVASKALDARQESKLLVMLMGAF